MSLSCQHITHNVLMIQEIVTYDCFFVPDTIYFCVDFVLFMLVDKLGIFKSFI